MTTPKTNGTGVKEVTPANKPLTPEQLKAQAKKEQEHYFDGLTDLVYKRSRFQEHKEAVEAISFDKEQADIFEHTQPFGGKIVLTDFSGNNYEIKNPKLVAELRDHLLELLNGKIETLEQGIVAYSEKKGA